VSPAMEGVVIVGAEGPGEEGKGQQPGPVDEDLDAPDGGERERCALSV
jgi:hypothetical protein